MFLAGKNNCQWMGGQGLHANDHWALTAPFSCQPDTLLLLVGKKNYPNPIFCSSLISLYDFQTKGCDYLNLESSLLDSTKPSLVVVMFTFIDIQVCLKSVSGL